MHPSGTLFARFFAFGVFKHVNPIVLTCLGGTGKGTVDADEKEWLSCSPFSTEVVEVGWSSSCSSEEKDWTEMWSSGSASLTGSPGRMPECPEFCSEPSDTELAGVLGWGCAVTAPSVAGCAALPSSAGDACGRRVSSPDCGDVG